MPRWFLLRAGPRISTLILATSLGLAPVLASESPAAESATEPEPVRLATEAFGGEARVEVRDLPETEGVRAARAALEEVLRIEALLDPRAPEPTPGGVAWLNARAGQGPQPIELPLLRFLARTIEFCTWSERANGPLGGRLFDLWGLGRPVEARPTPQQLLDATASAGCTRLRFDPQEGTVTLAAGSRLDLWPFATGWAADRAVAILRQHGAGNGYVEVGGTRRGFGPGPEGRGWRVTLPILPGYRRPLGEVWLKDRALAYAHYEDRRVQIAGDPVVPYLDQGTGHPAQGVVAVIAVAELGTDARALASTMFITGNLKGQFLLGQIRPAPSVRWLLGTGKGRPLIADFNWAALRRR
jgi:thiamine biosynthesis lipoprotein